MRKEYDLTDGERGKFFGKVDASDVIIDSDEETLDQMIEDELLVLESNLERIGRLRTRLSELDKAARNEFEDRISKARTKLDEIALPE